MSLWTRERINAGQRGVLAAGRPADAPFDVLARIAGLDPARDFRSTDLSGVDFAGSDLAGFDFSGARLWGCDFRGARIAGARFDKAELGRAPAATGGEQGPVVALHEHHIWPALRRGWKRSENPISDRGLSPYTIFQDAPFAPEMVVVPAGQFLMGSLEGEPGRDGYDLPQHQAAISEPFALGRFAVTFEEFDVFCDATQRKKPHDKRWGRGRRPAINVTCDEAEAYCAWLSHKTGVIYRLPTETEWEYACRAGTLTPFWWGSGITPAQANYDGSEYYEGGGAKGISRQRTEPVEAFQPNAWGLYQMHGNVQEWCAETLDSAVDGTRTNYSTWINSHDSLAISRGGSWSNYPQKTRCASRIFIARDTRSHSLGLRVARTLSNYSGE